MRAIGVSHTACKDEFRRNLRSHSWSAFSFFIIKYLISQLECVFYFYNFITNNNDFWSSHSIYGNTGLKLNIDMAGGTLFGYHTLSVLCLSQLCEGWLFCSFAVLSLRVAFIPLLMLYVVRKTSTVPSMIL